MIIRVCFNSLKEQLRFINFMTILVLNMQTVSNLNNSDSSSVAVFLSFCVGIFMWCLFLSLFVPHLSYFWCLRKAVLRDCGMSWISTLTFLASPKKALHIRAGTWCLHYIVNSGMYLVNKSAWYVSELRTHTKAKGKIFRMRKANALS